ncbi:hypothetical protein VTJ49DRAFT_6493 [Mycothermus thermophilus]|uniref:O-methyltransferase C-terminal domain-containing protein n=1 Tax=Humicola insolens TaxID=85995 RepID=A0ABR3V1S3_HUMIN
MGKFHRLSSFFSSSSLSSDSEAKKQNRRSFSFRGKEGLANGSAVKNASKTDTTAPKTSRMVELAQQITEATEIVENYFKSQGLPSPSFDVDAPLDYPQLPEDVQKARLDIICLTRELNRLAHGPRESVRWGIWECLDVLSLAALNHYGIAKLVPVDAPIPLADLQTKTTLDPINLARLLRVAMTNGVFAEPTPGVIAHTAASRVLRDDEAMQAWIGFNGEDLFTAAAHVLPALKAHPEATSLTRAGFQFAFDTVDREPMFVTFGKDPARAKRFGRAMVSLTGGEGYEPAYFVDVDKGGYDLSEVDEKEGTFVDVGGSHGFICVDLAKRYKKMRFVVQDLPKMIDSAPKPISEDPQVAERIELQGHDFFTEQVVKGADVYYFRWIIHNYSTPYAVRILKNLVPALKPGARIIINDHCLREAGQENPWDERVMRRMDVVMLALLNAQERTEEEFKALFAAADEGFVFKGVRRPKGCRMSIIEAVWQPDKVEKEEEKKAEEPKAVEETAVPAVTTTTAEDDKSKTEVKAETPAPAADAEASAESKPVENGNGVAPAPVEVKAEEAK